MPTETLGISSNISEKLRNVPIFSQLDETKITKIASICTTQILNRGEQLIAQGESANNFFIVVQGKFRVVSGDAPIDEIAPGEPIGEMAFFSGGNRSASVYAARQSEVIVVTRENYDQLVKDVPDLPGEIISVLAKRLIKAKARPIQLQPRVGTIMGIFPAADDVLDDRFIEQLEHLFADQSQWRLLKSEDIPNPHKIPEWIRSQEAASRRLVLLCRSPDKERDWADAIVETSDIGVIVADLSKDGGQVRGVSDFERRLYDTSLTTNLHLVLVRDRHDTSLRNTAQWLSGRPVGLHHHVALDQPRDLERLSRFLTGDALGLIFCGGGALGTAHLGMTKALLEHGFVFDMVGGTSMGAAIGGAYAMGLSPDEILDVCDDLFVRRRAMKRLTAPSYSIIDHRFFDEQLKDYYNGFEIEDLPLSFYAVATSLTHNDLSVQRHGSLWKAVRASCAIPGVFPPMITEDGEVLIDGALIDNVPLEAMRALKPGRNVVMNIRRSPQWRVHTNYDALPGRTGALKKLLLGKGVRFPRLSSILTRSMIVNSERRIARTDPGQDIIMETQSLAGMGFLEWEKGRRQFERAYDDTLRTVDAGAQDGLLGTELLFDIAERLSNGRATAWGQG